MGKFIKILFLVFMLLIQFHLSENSLMAQRFVTQEQGACFQIEKGEIDEAIGLLQKILESSPDNLNARLYLGIAFYMKKDLERSFKEFEKIEKEVERRVDFDRPPGWERPEDVDPKILENWIQKRGDTYFPEERKGLLYFCRGLTLKEKKDLKNAEKRFKKALKLKYDEKAVRVQLIDLYIEKKDVKKASKEVAELKKVAGESEFFAFLDGYIASREGNIQKALAAFEEMASSSLEAKKNVALIHYNKGDFQKAIEIWEEMLSENPEDKEAMINLGRVHFHLGNTEKAQEYFTKAGIQVSPDRYSPKKIPLTYETLVKEIKFDLLCEAK